MLGSGIQGVMGSGVIWKQQGRSPGAAGNAETLNPEPCFLVLMTQEAARPTQLMPLHVSS